MLTRVECLYELIENVFGKNNTTINYSGKTILCNDGLIKYCKFKSQKSMNTYCNHFEKIFYLALIDDKTEFKIKNENYDKNVAIENTFNYLTSKGVDFSKFDNYSFQNPEFIEILFTAIKKYILSTIFTVNPNKSENSAGNDNIEAEFNEAISEINAMLIYKNFLGYSGESIDKLNIIIDKGYNLEKCNFAIPVDLYKIYGESEYLQTVRIKEIKAYAERPHFKSTNLKPYKTKFDKLTSKFKKFDTEKNIIYCNPFLLCEDEYISNTDRSSEFEISNKHILPIDDLTPSYFFTYLDEKTIELLYPKVTTADELQNAMSLKIKIAYESYCKEKIPEYYHSLKMYIEDILERIVSMNLTAFLDCNPNHINKHMKNLELLNIKSNYIFSFLSLIDDEKERFFQYYMMIERVIMEFYNNLNIYNEKVKLSQEMMKYLDIDEYKEHIEKIKKICNNQKLSRAIEKQKYLVTSNSELYSYYIESVNFYDKKIYRYKTLFADLKKNLKEYYECLKKTLDKENSLLPEGSKP